MVLIDKPVGFSSFQIVRLFKKRYQKVGHAGTLDPFASGLLVMLIEQETKHFIEVNSYDKEYCGEILLGMSSDTYDICGRITASTVPKRIPTHKVLHSVAEHYVGTFDQTPPKYSALKQNGKKLYELSRKGIEIEPRPRQVTVHDFQIHSYQYPVVSFSTVVGKGVYVRSLAHDFGQELSTGAVLMSLRRMRIGPYEVSHALSIGALMQQLRGNDG